MTDVNSYRYVLTLTPQGALEVNSVPLEVPPEHRAGQRPLFWAMDEVNRQHLASGGELSLTVYDELTGGGKLTAKALPGQIVNLADLLPADTPRIQARERVRLPLPPMEAPGPPPPSSTVLTGVDTEPIPRVQSPTSGQMPGHGTPTLRTPPPPPPAEPPPAQQAPRVPVPLQLPLPASRQAGKPPSPVNALPRPGSTRIHTPVRAPSAAAPAPVRAAQGPPRNTAPAQAPGPLPDVAQRPSVTATPAPRPATSAARQTAAATAPAAKQEIVVRRRTPSQVAVREQPSSSPAVQFSWQRPDVMHSPPVVPPPLLANRPVQPRRFVIPRWAALVGVGVLTLVGVGAGWVAFGQQGPPSHSAVCVEATSMTRVAADERCEFPRRWWYVPPGQPIARVGQVVGVEGSFMLPAGEGARAETLKDDQPASE